MDGLEHARAYREAKDAVVAHRRVQAGAELALAHYLRERRGVPRDRLYGPDGAPKTATLANLEAAVDQAHADVQWCRALVVACGEQVKGEPFERAVERNDEGRSTARAGLGHALAVLED